MKYQAQQVCALLLLAAACCLSGVDSFVVPATSSTKTITHTTRSTELYSDAPANQQSQYGKDLAMPATYVRCGRCQTHYALKDDDLGPRGKGRRLECSICGHSWFQSRDRIMTMKEGFEMVERPQYEIDRVMLNIKENKAPNFYGDFKLYVGNIAFECVEQDIYEAFSKIGSVGDVSLVRDDIGRNRGFGFVTMRTAEQGEAAMAELDGTEIKGRNIAVRPSNN